MVFWLVKHDKLALRLHLEMQVKLDPVFRGEATWKSLHTESWQMAERQ